MSTAASIEVQLKSLPHNPGVYQFYDGDGKILYVGKAKDLRKRVSSYFNKKQENGKTRVLVKKIASIKHIVVATESDALLLENNLIKKLLPRYNVLLKDDKSYPWLCIKNEAFPRVMITRKLVKDGSQYFGPYTNMRTVRTLLELIKSLYPLRTCSYDLGPAKVQKGRYKVCLEYHLGNCLGPCEGLQREGEYLDWIADIRQIIKGNFKDSLQSFRLQMKAHAAAMEFERAQWVKERIEILENYQAKSTVVNPNIDNVDVFSIVSDPTHAYVNFLQLSHRAIIRSHTLEIKQNVRECDDDLLQLAIIERRQRFHSPSKKVYLPFAVPLQENLKVSLPKGGDKHKLLELSLRNAHFYRQDRLKQMRIVDPHRHTNRIMAQMQSDLRLPVEPRHIECFDNSNIQGSNPVAACVVFKDGKPSKKDYRHFNIRSVDGPDDFASMEEVVYRRYKRLLEEGEPLPQLIVIDGGKGQLSSALKSLEALDLRGKIAIIGIAKRLEEVYFPGDPVPLYLDKRSESLKIIQQLRNEAHRFGIAHHRNKRSKGAISSELEAIPGVGKNTAEQLLREFRSVKRIKAASVEELASTVGMAKAKKIYGSFHP